MEMQEALARGVVRAGTVETERFDWGEITWLDSADLTGSETLTVGVVTINAGASNPRHYHPNCDEALYLLQGELRHSIGDEVFPLKAGDLIHIPQGEWHDAASVGTEAARMVVCYNTGCREVVGEF